MRTSPSLGQAATVLLSLTSLVSAWPGWLPELDSLVVRQNSPPSATVTSNKGPTPTGGDAENTHNLNTGSIETPKPTASGTGGSSGDNKNSTKTGGDSKHSMFNPQDPPGGVAMMTPAVTAAMALYKIDNNVTFVWNYTSLQGTPTAVDVLASCSFATRTWTLTQNMTFETQGTYTWDTKKFQEDNKANQLLTEQYTLVIFDSDGGISATPEPGYLNTFQGLTFGMYEKQSYTPLASGWQCASCSGAMSDMDKRAIGFAVTMCTVTILSFTWFVTGLGLGL